MRAHPSNTRGACLFLLAPLPFLATTLFADEPASPAYLAPEPVRLVQPDYPRAAQTAGDEGSVLACFTIDEEGLVVEPNIRSSTSAVFDRAVLAALKDSRFNAARIAGEPVRATACRTWRFVLEPSSRATDE